MVLTAAQLADLMPDATQLESDEPEMESSLHYAQLALLVACLEMLWQDRSDFFIGANLTIYFSRQQLKTHEFRGPDFFLVRNTRNKPRKSWVVWEEDGKYPDLIIELLSDSTAATDRALKKELYQTRFHTPEYFWFSPETIEFQGFRLMGQQYEEIQPNDQGWLWSEVLNLFLGIHDEQLRYFTLEGQLVLTPLEAVNQTQDQLSQVQDQAAHLAEQLRSLGIEPQI
jgi:Uma2 family endonuclease